MQQAEAVVVEEEATHQGSAQYIREVLVRDLQAAEVLPQVPVPAPVQGA